MNPPEMSDRFATAFRSKLIDYVEQETRPRRLRALFGAVAVVAALAVGGGFAAYAGGVLNPEASLPDDVLNSRSHRTSMTRPMPALPPACSTVGRRSLART